MKIIYFIVGMFVNQLSFSQTSGSVTQGLGTTTANLMPACSSNHVTTIITIKSIDN